MFIKILNSKIIPSRRVFFKLKAEFILEYNIINIINIKNELKNQREFF